MVQTFHEKLQVSTRQRLADCDPNADQYFTYYSSHVQVIADYAGKKMQSDGDKRFLRTHLCAEEFAECLTALAERDELKLLDALADRLYVLLGMAITFDLPIVEAFEEVHRSNMTKEKQPDDAMKDRIRDKGPNYSPPDLAWILREYRRCER